MVFAFPEKERCCHYRIPHMLFWDCFLLIVSYSYLVFRIYQHFWFFTSLKNRREFTKRLLSHCQVKQSYLFLYTDNSLNQKWNFIKYSWYFQRGSDNYLNILNLISHTWNVGSHSIKFKASSVSFPAAYT